MTTSSKEIMKALINGKLVEAKEKTDELLYNKMANYIQDRYEDVAPPVFEGEKLDPVDKDELKGKHKDREDKDIDNDGDVDDSDKFLHKKRKAITKAMKKEDHDCDEIHPYKSHKEWEKTQNKEEGVEVDIAKEKENMRKSKIKIKGLSDRLSKEKETIRKDIKVDESSSARKAELIKKGRAGYKPGEGDREKGSYSKGGAVANDRRAKIFNKGREDRLKAKERKLKAIADKRKALSKERDAV